MTRRALAVGFYQSTIEIMTDSSAGDDRKDKVCLGRISETDDDTTKKQVDDVRCRS